MEANLAIPSLLPYLQRQQGKFAINITLCDPDVQQPLYGQRPFLIYNEDDPLSRLMGATIVSDDGTSVKPLLIRVQKDVYSYPNSTLAPLTNAQIDQTWQRVHGLRSKDPRAPVNITIADQVDASGRLRPFNALFYCRLRQSYFHPPCPRCGAPLEQCHDDQLLQQAQLTPFATSLARYMHCRPCHTRGTSTPFYAYDRQATDPEWLSDRRQLVHDIGQSPPETAHLTHVPCPTCPNHPLCFGKDSLVENYISFFSFYPFYLMFFDAGTLMAADFIKLISGASVSDAIATLESADNRARIATLQALPRNHSNQFLFPPQDPRHVLEILYLKLIFFKQIAHDISTQLATYHYPDIGLAFDSIWVQIAENDGLLPHLWNFKIQRNDIGRYIADSTQ